MSEESGDAKVTGIHVKCDSCNQHWFLTPEDIFEGEVQNSDMLDRLQAKYFVCPRCNKVFTFNLFNKNARVLMLQAEKLRSKMQAFGKQNNKRALASCDVKLRRVSKKLNREIAREVQKHSNGEFTLAQDGSKDLVFIPSTVADRSKGEENG